VGINPKLLISNDRFLPPKESYSGVQQPGQPNPHVMARMMMMGREGLYVNPSLVSFDPFFFSKEKHFYFCF